MHTSPFNLDNLEKRRCLNNGMGTQGAPRYSLRESAYTSGTRGRLKITQIVISKNTRSVNERHSLPSTGMMNLELLDVVV